MPTELSANAQTILAKRYYQPGEDWDGLLDRVSFGDPDFRKLMEDLEFLPNSPTLFNAGTLSNGTLSACFTADTVIHTLAGDFTVEALLARGEAEFEVFSTDGRKLKVGKAFALRKTKTNAKVYTVTFDSGDTIKLTAAHLVMMRDGSYKEVRSLAAGDSVMPFNHAYHKCNGHHRRHVAPKIEGKLVPAYQWAFRQATGRKVRKGHDVHHKDLDPVNDATSNLEELSDADHARLHILLDNPMHHPEAVVKISEQMMGNKYGVGPKPGTSAAMIGNQRALKDTPHPDPKKQYQREWMRRKSQEMTAARRRAAHNHKVVSVEFFGREDVYDLSVHKYHNFAANGVFIHNCFVFDFDDSLLDGPQSIMATMFNNQ